MKLVVVLIVSWAIFVHAHRNVVPKSEDNECTPSNLEKLKLVELLKLAQKSDICQKQANEVFRMKYANKEINICRKRSTEETSTSKLFIGCDIAEPFLSTFGHLIANLEVDDAEDEIQRVGALVNEYSSDTLVKLTVKSAKNGMFKNMRKPFNKVTTLVYKGDAVKEAKGHLELNRLFPELEYLDISKYSNNSIFNDVFAKLKTFKSLDDFELSESPSIFTKNKQLHKVVLSRPAFKDLAILQKHLDQLEYLDMFFPVDIDTYTGPALTFNSVKNLQLVYIDNQFRSGKLVFPQLKNLIIIFTNGMTDESLIFIKDNKHVETMSLFNIDENGVAKLPEDMPSLKRAVIVSKNNRITVATAVKFVTCQKHLELVVFQPHMDDIPKFRSEMEEKLGNVWKFETKNQHIYMTRNGQPGKPGKPGAASQMIAPLITIIALTSILLSTNVFSWF